MTDSTDGHTVESRSELPRSEPDLATLRTAIAQSAISVEPSAMADTVTADWAKLRHSEEVDAAILAWIMSHVRGADGRRIH
jgi:hypothetical protein